MNDIGTYSGHDGKLEVDFALLWCGRRHPKAPGVWIGYDSYILSG